MWLVQKPWLTSPPCFPCCYLYHPLKIPLSNLPLPLPLAKVKMRSETKAQKRGGRGVGMRPHPNTSWLPGFHLCLVFLKTVIFYFNKSAEWAAFYTYSLKVLLPISDLAPRRLKMRSETKLGHGLTGQQSLINTKPTPQPSALATKN